PPPTRQIGADLCLLRLEKGLTDDYKTIQALDISSKKLPIAYRVAGFPKGWDVDVSRGKIEVRDAAGLYMLRPKLTAAVVLAITRRGWFHWLSHWLSLGRGRIPGIISPGFSGGPVEVNDAIVGIVAESRSNVADVTAY